MTFFGAIKKANVSAVSWKQVLINTLLSAIVAGLTYGAEYITQIDFGKYGPLIVAASIPFITFIKQWIQEYLAKNKPEIDVIGKKQEDKNKNCK